MYTEQNEVTRKNFNWQMNQCFTNQISWFWFASSICPLIKRISNVLILQKWISFFLDCEGSFIIERVLQIAKAAHEHIQNVAQCDSQPGE